MLNIVANRMADKLLKHVTCVKFDKEVYVYGFELIISTVVGWIAILLNAVLWSELLSGIVFIVVFSSLRIFAGGYHADTYARCFVISNIFFIVLIILKKLTMQVDTYVWYGILLLAGMHIFRKAPIIHPKQPISEEKQKVCKRNVRLLLGIDSIGILFISIFNIGIAHMAILSIGLVALLMLVSDKHRNKIEEGGLNV